MSRFEDAVATRKRAERKKRQQFLKQQINEYKMASFQFRDAFWLFQFFALAEPSDQELAMATGIIETHVADAAAFLRELQEHFPKD